MINNIQVQGFNVLSELTHNENGNPHNQYVGNNPDTMIKPSFDLNNVDNNVYWKIASFSLVATNKTNVTLCFDLFDEYQGLIISKSNFEINYYPNGEPVSSTNYYKNGVFKRLFGSEYDRLYSVESILEGKVYIELYIKTLTKYNFPKISITYKNINETSFKIYNNERMSANLPDGDVFTNIPDKKVLNSIKSTANNTFVKLANFDFNYNGANKVYIFDIYKSNVNTNVPLSSCKAILQIFNSGGNITTNFYLKDTLNINIGELILTSEGGKMYSLYGKFLNIGEIYSISLNNHLDYSFTGSRELQIVKGKELSNFTGSAVKTKYTNSSYLCDNTNVNTYKMEILGDNFWLKNLETNNYVAGMVKQQTFSDSVATDITTLKNDFNALVSKLKQATVLK